MKLQFIGCGSAFTTPEYWQSNALITADSGKKLLIDCGGDVRHALSELEMSYMNINAIYISHLHADHIDGLEWMSLNSYFDPRYKVEHGGRPLLYTVKSIMGPLWTAIKGGHETIQGQIANLTTFYDCKPVSINKSFEWENITFTPVQTVHIMSGYKICYSFGLLIKEGNGPTVFFTADTQFAPNQLKDFYTPADIIFHDCETGFMSRVHAHFDELKTLDPSVKGKMWLYHYQPNPP